MNANDIKSKLLSSKCEVYDNITWSFEANRCRRLLAEFLERESARKQANAEEETDLEMEVQNQVTVSDDLLFKILILLPSESLFRLQFVCKKWFCLINSSIFISCHSQQSETVLLCKRLSLSEPTYAASQSQGSENKPKSYFHFLDLDHGDNRFIESSVVELVDIRASYDGLILANIVKSKSLILVNPITRKHIMLPFSRELHFLVESFGIAFCNKAKTYKIIRLFWDVSGWIGCDILSICTRKCTRIEGPPFEMLRDIRQVPVTVGGSVSWMPKNSKCDYFISMNLKDEKFVSKNLPVSSASRDRLLEIGGDLGFVTHVGLDLLQVWILITDGGSGENWIKRYSIDVSVYEYSPFSIPICCTKNGKGMVLEMMHQLYVYNFETGEMKLIPSTYDDQVWSGMIDKEYIPHRNSLASWEDHLEVLF